MNIKRKLIPVVAVALSLFVLLRGSESLAAGDGTNTGGGYSAEILIDDADKLLIGMTAKAKIILDEKENVLAVPYDSIKQNDDGTFSVFIAEQSGDKGGYKAKEVKIEKGMETNYLTEIISSDLSDGDIILTDVTTNGIVDGADVTIAEPYTDPDKNEDK